MEKVVLRTCAYSRELNDRQTMFRVVKTPNHEIKIDLTYHLPGRGVYLSRDKDIMVSPFSCLVNPKLKATLIAAISLS